MTAPPAVHVPAQADRVVRSAVLATYVAFGGSGFAFATWASRVPQVRDRLGFDPSELGLLLLSIAAGSVVALPLSGALIQRIGTRWTVRATALLLAAALLTVAFGYRIGTAPVAAGLFVLGLANGAWDVAMNVQAAAVERRLGRSVMSRFHAGFSLGTVVGALVGAAMVALDVTVTIHLTAVAVIVACVVPRGVALFLPDVEPDGRSGRARARTAWTEPRTLVVGLFVLAFAFAEGAGLDWIGIAVIDGYGQSATVGTLAFATFLATMTVGRWFGPVLLDSYGRVPVVRALAGLGAVGVALFVLAPWTALAFVGALLWGLGVSLGFPVGMSAGADDPQHAASRVSVIASLGYCAFLAGPPLIGLLGDRFTVRHALTAVAMMLAVAVLVSPAVREQEAGPA